MFIITKKVNWIVPVNEPEIIIGSIPCVRFTRKMRNEEKKRSKA